MRPKKYDVTKQTWYDRDMFPDCEKQIRICPKCGHMGHLSLNLNQNITYDQSYSRPDSPTLVQVIKYIHHSHFIHDTDRGRHVRCEIGRIFVDPKHACDVVYQLKGPKNIPKWIREELYGE